MVHNDVQKETKRKQGVRRSRTLSHVLSYMFHEGGGTTSNRKSNPSGYVCVCKYMCIYNPVHLLFIFILLLRNTPTHPVRLL